MLRYAEQADKVADALLASVDEGTKMQLAEAYVLEGDITAEALEQHGVDRDDYSMIEAAFSMKADVEARKAGLGNLAEWLDCLPTEDWAEARHWVVTGRWDDIRSHMRKVAAALKEAEE